MIWILIAISGQVILGTAAVFDKLLLRTRVPDAVIYTFWIGILGIFSAVLLPFGFVHVSFFFIFIGIIAGMMFTVSLLALYTTLAKTNASSSLPFIAALVPLFTLPFSMFILATRITYMDIIGILLLIIGALFFFFAKKIKLRLHVLIWICASAALYGFSSVLQKIIFEHANFITGFFWVKMGEALCASLFLLMPHLRKRIWRASSNTNNENKIWYMANRAWAASGSVLLNIAIFLSHPALIQATQSLRYVVIFIASWIFLRERSYGKELKLKMIATLLVVIGISWLGLTEYARNIPYDPHRAITWGVTFSEKFSRELGIDPQKSLDMILHDLHPHAIRFIAYWDEIEKKSGEFDFSELDWQLAKAADTHTPVIFALGMKSPRWPECFVPESAAGLETDQKEIRLQSYMQEVILHYRNQAGIIIWQIENEPFLGFGLCPKRSPDILEKEMALVRSLDQSRPILLSDGGEYGRWYSVAKRADIFGTTMYRKIYPPTYGRFTGAFEYPLAPSFFRLKEKIVRLLLNDYTKPFIVIELQAEPWGRLTLPLISVSEQRELFSPEYFSQTIEYAKQTGFSTYYLWGAEWWYFMGTTQDDWTYWNRAKELMKRS